MNEQYECELLYEIEQLRAQLEAAQAQVARMRAALEKIRDNGPHGFDALGCATIAERALKEARTK